MTSTPTGVANNKEKVEMITVDHEKLYGHIVTGDEPLVVSSQRGDANSADKVFLFFPYHKYTAYMHAYTHA
jgi:hypothetical protein